MMPLSLDDHFFRHEYGRLVAVLTRRAGAQHLELVEDAVQSALMSALDAWSASGLPKSPSAWLFRAAHNELLDELRKRSRRERLLSQKPDSEVWVEGVLEPHFAAEVNDSLLRMLYLCCDEAIPADSQLVLALKVLCGFNVREIALRLFVSEASVYKRLERARKHLRRLSTFPEDFIPAQVKARLPAVQKVLYLLFTEGHLSSDSDSPIRLELCDEALRLATLLAEHRDSRAPSTYALLSLFYLHAARLPARQDEAGGVLLLEEQDRSLWDQKKIKQGIAWLARSAVGESPSRYHFEAAIAAAHCLAASLKETDWKKIVEYYESLERLTSSPVYRLNRALALAEWRGPEEGLALLDGFRAPPWLEGSHLWAAVFTDLHTRCGHREKAETYRQLALDAAPSAAIVGVLKRRWL